MLLALDPSVSSPGAALFMKGRLLVAGRVRITTRSFYSEADRWLQVARDICEFTHAHGAWQIETVDRLVFEMPQIYRAQKSKGDPNKLIGLAGISMALAGMLRSKAPELEVLCPTPSEWIGQCPKATKGSAKLSPRAQRILSRLDENEKSIVPDQHDALDAVGIGLWCLKRLEIRRSLTNK